MILIYTVQLGIVNVTLLLVPLLFFAVHTNFPSSALDDKKPLDSTYLRFPPSTLTNSP